MHLLGERCDSCGAVGRSPCATCAAALRAADAVAVPDGLDGLTALLAYEGAGRTLVTALKYRNRRACLARLGHALARAAVDTPDGLVTWVPAAPTHRRRRGYDQGALLARQVAHHLGRPLRPLLARVDTGSQTGRDRLGRLAGPSLVLRRPATPRRGPVLVVDDVVTTGASLRAAASLLRSVGADPVHAAVLAATPLKVGARRADNSE